MKQVEASLKPFAIKFEELAKERTLKSGTWTVTLQLTLSKRQEEEAKEEEEDDDDGSHHR
jgi:hypothetical protein